MAHVVDVVALVSVSSSGALALGSLFVSYRAGREQRRHEAGLAFQERVWDAKSEAVLGAIHLGSTMRRAIDAGDDLSVAQELSRQVEDTWRWRSGIEAYGSDATRTAYEALVSLIDNTGATMLTWSLVVVAREKKEAAIDRQDFDEAARMRDQERKVLRRATEEFTFEPATLRAAAVRLLEAARADLRVADV